MHLPDNGRILGVILLIHWEQNQRGVESSRKVSTSCEWYIFSCGFYWPIYSTLDSVLMSTYLPSLYSVQCHLAFISEFPCFAIPISTILSYPLVILTDSTYIDHYHQGLMRYNLHLVMKLNFLFKLRPFLFNYAQTLE